MEWCNNCRNLNHGSLGASSISYLFDPQTFLWSSCLLQSLLQGVIAAVKSADLGLYSNNAIIGHQCGSFAFMFVRFHFFLLMLFYIAYIKSSSCDQHYEIACCKKHHKALFYVKGVCGAIKAKSPINCLLLNCCLSILALFFHLSQS